jgi:hypothetical protein
MSSQFAPGNLFLSTFCLVCKCIRMCDQLAIAMNPGCALLYPATAAQGTVLLTLYEVVWAGL